MRKRRKSYFPRYREPMSFDIGEILVEIIFIALIVYIAICPFLHTMGVEPDKWSWVYWFFQIIENIK